jgi:hypothetical protein
LYSGKIGSDTVLLGETILKVRHWLLVRDLNRPHLGGVMNLKMRAMKAATGLLVFGATASPQVPAKRVITFRDLIAMHRVSDVQLSPDGQWVAYTVGAPDLEADRISRDMSIVISRPSQMQKLVPLFS